MYGLAHQSILKQLDLIHHQGLCIALGAFRTSPAQSLYIEAHEPSLTTRQLKLSLNYVLKLKSLPENPAYSYVFEPENPKLFEESESKVPPLGIRILPHLEKSKLNLNLVDDAPSLETSSVPWKLPVPAVRFDLASFKKDTTNPEIYKQLYLQLISEYPLSEKIFTDSSKTEEGVAAVAVSTKQTKKNFYMLASRQQFNMCSRVEGNSFSSQKRNMFIIPKKNHSWYYLIPFHHYSQF